MEEKTGQEEKGGIFSRYRSEIILTVMIVYVLLLMLGTVGELFDIEWILKLPIFN